MNETNVWLCAQWAYTTSNDVQSFSNFMVRRFFGLCSLFDGMISFSVGYTTETSMLNSTPVHRSQKHNSDRSWCIWIFGLIMTMFFVAIALAGSLFARVWRTGEKYKRKKQHQYCYHHPHHYYLFLLLLLFKSSHQFLLFSIFFSSYSSALWRWHENISDQNAARSQYTF